MTNSVDETKPLETSTNRWRVVDIVVAAVLGVAVGLIFFIWNSIGYAWFKSMDALTPGLGGLATGIWLLGGPLGALIIRKPGAALFVELVAALVSTLIGNVWAIETMYSGLAQGLGAELVFLAARYRSFKLPTALIAGACSGIGAWCLELFLSPNYPKGLMFNSIYLVCLIISGAILAGLVAWLLTSALRKTGVLYRFASGRQ